uniref:BACK domain-containing protein n=1 Tax=Trichuris muris TaxID=70415 RepID=A0A5S6QAR1_TRIMR
MAALSIRKHYLHTKVIYDAVKLFIKSSNVPVQIIAVAVELDERLYFQLRGRWESSIFRFVELNWPSLIRRRKAEISKLSTYKGLNCAQTVSDIQRGVHHVTNRYALAEFSFFHCDELMDLLIYGCSLCAGVPTLFLFGNILERTHVYEFNRILEAVPIAFLKCAVIIQEEIIADMYQFATNTPMMDSLRSFNWLHIGMWPAVWLFYNYVRYGRCDTAIASLPFNEYEIWHLLCARDVFVVGATFNLYMNRLLGTFGHPTVPIHFDVDLWGHVKAENITTLPPYNRERINCSCVALGEQMLILGGLEHCSTNGYRPCENIMLFGVQNQTINDAVILNIDDLKKITQRVHHSITRVTANSFIVYGGWKDYYTPLSDPWHGKLVSECNLVFAPLPVKNTKTGSYPCARWRHSACLVENIFSGSAVFICGGLTRRVDHLNVVRTFSWVLQDAWTLEWEYGIWRRLPDLPVPLHSHQCTYIASDSMVVAIGGLGTTEDEFSSKIFFFSFDLLCWCKEIDLEPKVGRYGFTSHVLTEEVLLLVGGVNEKFAKCNTMTLVDLKNALAVHDQHFVTFCSRGDTESVQ